MADQYSQQGGARKKKLSRGRRFCKCIKTVRKTLKTRPGSTKEQGAIAVCVKSVLQTRGRTVKRFKCGKKPRVITQERKARGGYHVQLTRGELSNMLHDIESLKYEDDGPLQLRNIARDIRSKLPPVPTYESLLQALTALDMMPLDISAQTFSDIRKALLSRFANLKVDLPA